jgi:hypothetical protein
MCDLVCMQLPTSSTNAAAAAQVCQCVGWFPSSAYSTLPDLYFAAAAAAVTVQVEYINLRGSSYDNPAVCKYTGNKYYSDPHTWLAH